jgi:hypothetical protein
MSYITEIQEAIVVVIIWWCDLQLHMSCNTEIQDAVVVVIIWWCDIPWRPLVFKQYMTYVVVNHTTWSYGGVIYNCIFHVLLKYKRLSWSWSYGDNHMITNTKAPCISVMYDICSCKSHQHMITTTAASCISVIYDICSCKSHHHMITTILLKYKRPS